MCGPALWIPPRLRRSGAVAMAGIPKLSFPRKREPIRRIISCEPKKKTAPRLPVRRGGCCSEIRGLTLKFMKKPHPLVRGGVFKLRLGT